MTHKQFLLKHALLERLTEQTEEYVHDVLKKYIKDKKIRFSWMDKYTIVNDGISVEQFDDNYYNYERIVIPMRYFIDYDAAIAADKEAERLQKEKEKAEQELDKKLRQAEKQTKERNLFLKLKEKYEK